MSNRIAGADAGGGEISRSRGGMMPDSRWFRLVMNAYPQFLFSSVRVQRIATDWTSVEVSHRVRPWNRNANRAAFGGTLFSMTDPFYGIMALGQLGPGYRVWNTCASIEFVAPGRGTVSATMELDPDVVAEIRDRTANGAKSITAHVTEIRDGDGAIVAKASQDLYVRRLH
ncbi:DUF4442 domain-containing protein [Nocardia arthritidis]|uniref:DUF4442 domain-containing protein n=1 Tax=Nocardia arthritidis TaxID=228602 RepID=UPI00142D4493|nr:DUF4442 domain-containing protein [Nocardia arthritidis]